MEAIFAERLKRARQKAGLSMDKLVLKIDNQLSKNAISKYEKGINKPNSQTILLLANALDVSVDYFFRKPDLEIKPFEFRKKAKLGVTRLKSIKETVIDLIERYYEIEHGILEQNNLFENHYTGEKINDSLIEEIAQTYRKKWNLGNNPILNLIETLEDKGVKIIEVDEESSFDGMQTIINETYPIIVINKNFGTERKRFTLAHELGHVIFSKINDLSQKKAEDIANRFAGEFLLPKQELILRIGQKRKKISLKELKEIQEYFGISIQAIMHRALDTGIITEAHHRNFYITLNSNPELKANINGERFSGKEESNRFEVMVMKALTMELITISKAATLLRKSTNEIMDNFVTL